MCQSNSYYGCYYDFAIHFVDNLIARSNSLFYRLYAISQKYNNQNFWKLVVVTVKFKNNNVGLVENEIEKRVYFDGNLYND